MRGLFRRVTRPRIDLVYLLIFLLLLSLGAVMSYSASAVYGKTFYGDSAYFFKRYLFFAFFSLAAIVPFVLFATPQLWARIGVWLYIASILLLLLVLLIVFMLPRLFRRRRALPYGRDADA